MSAESESENGVAPGEVAATQVKVTATGGRGGHVDAEVKVASIWIDGAPLQKGVKKTTALYRVEATERGTQRSSRAGDVESVGRTTP